MPTYEYECDKCGNKFELMQSMNANTVTQCPKCGENSKRLIGRGMVIIFKGSGFYETDYKRKAGDKKESDIKSCPMKKECGGCDGKN